jgi:hypothetical protein
MSRTAKASLLLFFFSLCASAFLVTHIVRESVSAPVPRDLFAVVNDQLMAFRVADFESAYRHAASGVQQKFTLPEFENMVRGNYVEMTRTHRIEFGPVEVRRNSALVQVFFIASDGSVRRVIYSLISEGDAWKIDAVKEIGPRRRDQRLAGSHV